MNLPAPLKDGVFILHGFPKFVDVTLDNLLVVGVNSFLVCESHHVRISSMSGLFLMYIFQPHHSVYPLLERASPLVQHNEDERRNTPLGVWVVQVK